MELSLKSSTNNRVTTFPPQRVYEFNKEAFADHALTIHSLISIELGDCPKITKHRRRRALFLIERLDSILESLEDINELYGYYYHLLLEMLENCDVNKKIGIMINENLWSTPKY